MGSKLSATLVEVGPRDGFQSIGPLIPTERKVDLIRQLHAAGLRRIEAAAFVSDKALPQMADAAAILDATKLLPDIDVQVLVPSWKYAELAVAAGARHVAFVLSVSNKHNMKNVRRTPAESVAEYAHLVRLLPPEVRIRLNVATAFDCPFDGLVSTESTLNLLAALLCVRPNAEVALCDTTGRVTPDRISALFKAAKNRFPETGDWVFHGHDTYGLGIANILAAFEVGVRVFDSSFGGLGGCPFAPGATGNVATEDVVWAFERMGIATGVHLESLLRVAEQGAALPGALSGGRVRDAVRGARRAGVSATV